MIRSFKLTFLPALRVQNVPGWDQNPPDPRIRLTELIVSNGALLHFGYLIPLFFQVN